MTIRKKRALLTLGSHVLFTLAIVAVVAGYAFPEGYVDQYPAAPVLLILGASILCADLRRWGQAYLGRQALAQMLRRTQLESKVRGMLATTHWDLTANPEPCLIIYCGAWEQMRVEGVISSRLARAKWVGRQLAIIRPTPQDCDPKAWAEALGPNFEGVIVQGGERLTWSKPEGVREELWELGAREI